MVGALRAGRDYFQLFSVQCSAQGSEDYRIKEIEFAATGYTTHWWDETNTQFWFKKKPQRCTYQIQNEWYTQCYAVCERDIRRARVFGKAFTETLGFEPSAMDRMTRWKRGFET